MYGTKYISKQNGSLQQEYWLHANYMPELTRQSGEAIKTKRSEFYRCKNGCMSRARVAQTEHIVSACHTQWWVRIPPILVNTCTSVWVKKALLQWPQRPAGLIPEVNLRITQVTKSANEGFTLALKPMADDKLVAPQKGIYLLKKNLVGPQYHGPL